MGRIEFLWRTLESLENRITLLDNKSSIMIGIETAVLALAALLTDKTMDANNTAWIGYGLIGLTAAFAALIVPLLLHAIRPTQCYFQRRARLDLLPQHYLIWPAESIDRERLKSFGRALTEQQMSEDLIANVFVRQQLLQRKYRRYDVAMVIMKIQAPVILVTIVGVCIARLLK